MKSRITWILTVNSKSARAVVYRGPGLGLTLLPDRYWEFAEPEGHTDRQGRTFSRTQAIRHKLEPHTKALNDRDRFAKQLVRDLAGNLRSGQFESLIICAAPSMLGSLRKSFTMPLQHCVRAEVAKDLNGVPVHELASHLGDVLPV
ncbi:host attachment protein [Hoeflea prorocentri]|uniref:Host attachment protein n=1 Tax=Hoeflea prorocentri TaxID=1922333 RepID=A0A9X3ZG86_9HYPH|nr:host attachment protein [Hoeflea prorocentri]MCY6379663.1 host attachment protein [Hoeflea prorocentri]MDA5397463.1 host attachment protein [Hoeflea prorocentri]